MTTLSLPLQVCRSRESSHGIDSTMCSEVVFHILYMISFGCTVRTVGLAPGTNTPNMGAWRPCWCNRPFSSADLLRFFVEENQLIAFGYRTKSLESRRMLLECTCWFQEQCCPKLDCAHQQSRSVAVSYTTALGF